MAKEIQSKTILNKSKRRDPWFLDDYSLNPYSGCSFNCLYCYIRGSKYGEHMEKSLGIKINAAELLEKRLSYLSKKEKYGIIVLGSATDPYLQLEKDVCLTRELLSIILKYRFPLHIITKSDLIIRDIELLKEISKNGILPDDLKGKLKSSLAVSFSFSTIENDVSKIFEPGATMPSQRIETIKLMLAEGFSCGISMMPLLPYITDTSASLEAMYGMFSGIGVNYLFGAGLTLFGNTPADSRVLMFNAVKKHYPQLYGKYEKLFGNSDYLPAFYSNALSKKLFDLNRKYGIPAQITVK